MAETVLVSERGQITLPTAIRKKYAIQKDTPLLLEDTGEGILLRRVSMIPLKVYNDEEIRQWMREDKILPQDKKWLKRK